MIQTKKMLYGCICLSLIFTFTKESFGGFWGPGCKAAIAKDPTLREFQHFFDDFKWSEVSEDSDALSGYRAVKTGKEKPAYFISAVTLNLKRRTFSFWLEAPFSISDSEIKTNLRQVIWAVAETRKKGIEMKLPDIRISGPNGVTVADMPIDEAYLQFAVELGIAHEQSDSRFTQPLRRLPDEFSTEIVEWLSNQAIDIPVRTLVSDSTRNLAPERSSWGHSLTESRAR